MRVPLIDFVSTSSEIHSSQFRLPVGEEHGEADGLKDAGQRTDGNGVERTLLGDDLGDDLKFSQHYDISLCVGT